MVAVASVAFGSLVHRTSKAATNITIQDIVQNVTLAQGYRYGTHDSAGNTMDTAKVLDNPAGGYLAVYHTGHIVKLATSTDLLNWTYKTDLDPLDAGSTFGTTPSPTPTPSSTATPTPSATPTPTPAGKVGDLNNDGQVNIFDLSILLSAWGTANTTADLNHDGTVNVFDLSILLSKWGT